MSCLLAHGQAISEVLLNGEANIRENGLKEANGSWFSGGFIPSFYELSIYSQVLKCRYAQLN